MTDRELVLEVPADDPLGAMHLVTTATFGQRVAALSGVAVAGDRTEPGLFDSPAALSWPWPDWTTCSAQTHHVEDGPVNFA